MGQVFFKNLENIYCYWQFCAQYLLVKANIAHVSALDNGIHKRITKRLV